MSQVAIERAGQRVFGVTHPRLLDAGIVAAGSLLMAVCAHVSIPLWFTPVPITLQTFGVLLLTLTLGGWRASAALVLYLVEGICGMPVFSPHGLGGMAQLLGPTGGYLMAYPLAALLGGLLAERFALRNRLAGLICAAVFIEWIVFAGGLLWLLALTHLSPRAAAGAALLPFIPGEVIKLSAAVAIALKSKLLAAN
jgi:biotin transport system substrate-specific component